MATYLQGVTDYIPDYQPFQPDLNFYANVLQAKQTQYDTNWKQVNNLYAELHNADLTHDLNVKKKDDLLKQIDFNIKRVAGLDLSLQQNVDQATQVFRPFYEDKYLMKDMAWTKNYNSTLSRALNLNNSQDEKMRSQYWDEGVKEMQYRKQEFKDSTLDETLNFGNVRYTPKVDVLSKYQEIFKKSGLSVDIKDVDASGMYFVREKNGKVLLAPLQKLFMTSYINDPATQAFYATQAYVKRKDYAEQNASRFNGNKAEAEKEYLRDQYKWLQNKAKEENVDAKDAVSVNKNKTATVEKQILDKDANPYSESYLDTLNKAMAIDETVANHADKINKEVNGDATSSVTMSRPQGDPSQLDFSNMELARLKVDSAFASSLAERDINAAADIYSYTNYVYEKSVNPVGLEGLRHKNSIARLDYASKLKMGEMQYKAQLDRETARIEQGLADGTIWYDKDNKMHVDYGDAYKANWGSTSGQVADEFNVMAKNVKDRDEAISNLTGDYIGRTLTHLNNLAEGDSQITSKELWNAVSFLDPNSKEAKDRYKTRDGKQLVAQLYKKYQENPGKFVLEFSKNNQVLKLKKFMDSWSSRNAGHPIAYEYNSDASNAKIERFKRFNEASKIVDQHNYNKISKNLISALESNEDFKNLKDDTKQKIVDVYIKNLKTGKQPEKGKQTWSGKTRDESEQEVFEKFLDQQLGYNKFATKRHIATRGEIEAGIESGDRPYRSGFRNKTGINIGNLFDVMTNAYNKTINQTGDDGLMSYAGVVRKQGGRYALASNDLVAKDVILSKPGYGGFRDFQQAMQDINRIKFAQDPSKYAVTYGGTTITAAEKYRFPDPGKVKQMLKELQLSAGKKSTTKFTIARDGMALENPDLRAFRIKPSKEILDKYFKTADGKVNTSVVNAILKNGISFIAPKSEWTNDFMLENELTPTEMILNAKKKIEYVQGNGAGKYIIEKVSNVPGVDYRVNYTGYLINRDGSVQTKTDYLPLQKSGNKVDDSEDALQNMLREIDEQNKETYKQIQMSGDTEAMRRVKEFFANPVKGGYQY